MYGERDRLKKETVLLYFRILSRHSPWWGKGKHDASVTPITTWLVSFWSIIHTLSATSGTGGKAAGGWSWPLTSISCRG